MPYKHNEPRRHKIPKARYRVENWREYEVALRDRGSLTVWVTPEAIAAWHPARTGRPGRSAHYSDLAIETGVMLRLAFARPWRQTEGLLRSVTTLLGLSLGMTLAEPFLQVAFLPLPVIPHLKITDRGLVDVDKFEFVRD